MHFTYKRPEGDLQQGDLLRTTEDLSRILKEFHPHYADNPDYPFLIVLTQSCDLARGGGRRHKSRYITLGAVRPLEEVVERELEKYRRSSIENSCQLCPKESRHWIKDFLNKLLNNNLTGYFYLAQEAELKISAPHVAFLALSIAIKSEHYDVCLDARFAQLREVFQAKLGWLVGEMYSRVGTPDWVPTQLTKEQFEELLEEMLEGMTIWVPQGALQKLRVEQETRRRQYGNKDYQIPQEEVPELLRDYTRDWEDRPKRIVEAFIAEALKSLPEVSGQELKNLKYRLMGNEELERMLSQSP